MIRLRVKWPYDPWCCSCCGVDVTGRAPSSVLSGLVCDDCLDRGYRGEPYVPLTIRPIQPRTKRDERPIVAVSMLTGSCSLDTGEVFDLPELVDRIRERKSGEVGAGWDGPPRLPPSIVVTDHGLELLGYLEHSPAAASVFWQWQVSIRGAGAWRPEASSKRSRAFLIAKPVRFGYASRHGKRTRAKGRAHWFLLIDPAMFCELPGGWGQLNLLELMQFGTALRGWANDQGLPIFAGVSSYGSRLLKDARFGGGWRRKVPAATNKRLRNRLPGNHYQLLTGTDQTHRTAHKYDQHAAHHHAAVISRFPHSDLLDARGHFRRPGPPAGTPFLERGAIRAGTDRWHELLTHAGMFTLAVHVPELVAIDQLTIPALRYPGRTWQTMTSVELAHARTIPGVRLLDIWAAWSSPEEDDRLRDYALWSGAQLGAATAQSRRWLKPLLLAAYGMLAVKPSRFRNAWKWSYRSDGAIGWQTSSGILIGQERSGDTDQEPQTANVLWRAIIESSVRLESLRFAQQLRSRKRRPVSVYADAVFATGRPLSNPPIPWRYEGPIHDLTFDAPARYRSREEVRLPGTPRGRDQLRAALT